MRRIIISILAASQILFLSAQTEYDGIKMLDNDIIGSARYTAMAGAFATLGGDASAIKDNPAALGIFRKSEISTTLNTAQTSTFSAWNNSDGYIDTYTMGFNQLSLVLTRKTANALRGSEDGLLMSNWSFGYNRLKNFSRALRINSNYANSSMTDYIGSFTGNLSGYYVNDDTNYEPFDNVDIPWISVMGAYGGLITEEVVDGVSSWYPVLDNGEKVKPTYSLNESGYMDEYSFAWSGNISNRLFVGASLNFLKYHYQATSAYGENFENGGSFEFDNTLTTTGTSAGLKIGAIYAPLDFMRVSASVQAPQVMKVEDSNRSTLYFDILDKGNITSPYGSNSYKFRMPVKYSAGLGFILGRFALIDAEWNYTRINDSQFTDMNNSSIDYYNENEGFKTKFNNAQTLRLGAEIKLTDYFALRGGFAYTDATSIPGSVKIPISNTVRTDTEYFLHNGTQYISAGVGYRDGSWYIDGAFIMTETSEDFLPYNKEILAANYQPNSASVVTARTNLLLTVGFKF